LGFSSSRQCSAPPSNGLAPGDDNPGSHAPTRSALRGGLLLGAAFLAPAFDRSSFLLAVSDPARRSSLNGDLGPHVEVVALAGGEVVVMHGLPLYGWVVTE